MKRVSFVCSKTFFIIHLQQFYFNPLKTEREKRREEKRREEKRREEKRRGGSE
jgi:hypothetical protein